MINTEVIIPISPLEKKSYTFWFNDGVLILETYHHLVKENTRQRNFRTKKFYNRLSGAREMNFIPEEQVLMTSEIRNLALIEFHKQITVKTWSEYKALKYRAS